MAAASKTILLVDDDINVHELLGEILSKHGYRTVSALRGEDAFEKARQEKPNLVLLDINMNGVMDGFDVLKQLKKGKETLHIRYSCSRAVRTRNRSPRPSAVWPKNTSPSLSISNTFSKRSARP